MKTLEHSNLGILNELPVVACLKSRKKYSDLLEDKILFSHEVMTYNYGESPMENSIGYKPGNYISICNYIIYITDSIVDALSHLIKRNKAEDIQFIKRNLNIATEEGDERKKLIMFIFAKF